ncbi:MAG: hypothetical protein IPK00_19070 [Deltaproteobacteria bacterium]|nr:hypothetical protein [Deltaproteobacteria bacterium]
MVNLLGRRGGPTATPRFDARTLDRIAVRLPILFGLARSGGLARVGRAVADLAPLLEELDVAPSRLTAEDLLEALDGLRDEALASATPDARGDGAPPAALPVEREELERDGGFVVHRPGRSLSTGEAEIASRGYFDVVDRPPIATWLGVLDATSDGVDDGVWIAAWVGPREVERARAGCRACPNGALVWLDDVSSPAAAQLQACARVAAGSRLR